MKSYEILGLVYGFANVLRGCLVTSYEVLGSPIKLYFNIKIYEIVLKSL